MVELDARALRDAADVALDVRVGVEAELTHGDEALVHGVGSLGADAVALGDIQDELEVRAVVE